MFFSRSTDQHYLTHFSRSFVDIKQIVELRNWLFFARGIRQNIKVGKQARQNIAEICSVLNAGSVAITSSSVLTFTVIVRLSSSLNAPACFVLRRRWLPELSCESSNSASP